MLKRVEEEKCLPSVIVTSSSLPSFALPLPSSLLYLSSSKIIKLSISLLKSSPPPGPLRVWAETLTFLGSDAPVHTAQKEMQRWPWFYRVPTDTTSCSQFGDQCIGCLNPDITQGFCFNLLCIMSISQCPCHSHSQSRCQQHTWIVF